MKYFLYVINFLGLLIILNMLIMGPIGMIAKKNYYWLTIVSVLISAGILFKIDAKSDLFKKYFPSVSALLIIVSLVVFFMMNSAEKKLDAGTKLIEKSQNSANKSGTSN